MSLWVIGGGLSFAPRVRAERGRLEIRTNAFFRALGLFSMDHRVIVDRAARNVRIFSRRWWASSSEREIGFDRIDHLDYDYEFLTTSWTLGAGSTDGVEVYTISLVLKEGREKVVLCRFQGDGAVATGAWGVLMGDDWLDLEGSQGEGSRGLVRALTGMMGLPLGAPIPKSAFPPGRSCRACGRPSPGRLKRCQYCGGAVTSGEAPSGRP